MPDNSIECILGRLLEAVDNIKIDIDELKTQHRADIDELKRDHKNIASFIDEQKHVYKYVWAFVAFLGGAIYFGEDVYKFIMQTKGH